MVSIALVDAPPPPPPPLGCQVNMWRYHGLLFMVSIALVDARKTSLTGVQNSTKKIGSPLRGSWTMLRIVVGSNPPPLGKKLDPPLSRLYFKLVSLLTTDTQKTVTRISSFSLISMILIIVNSFQVCLCIGHLERLIHLASRYSKGHLCILWMIF